MMERQIAVDEGQIRVLEEHATEVSKILGLLADHDLEPNTSVSYEFEAGTRTKLLDSSIEHVKELVRLLSALLVVPSSKRKTAPLRTAVAYEDEPTIMSQMALTEEEVVQCGCQDWRTGIEASLRTIKDRQRVMPDLQSPAYKQALIDVTLQLEAMLESGSIESPPKTASL